MTQGAWPAEDERVPQLGVEDQRAYDAETRLSWALSRWLAAPLYSAAEREAYAEVCRLRGGQG